MILAEAIKTAIAYEERIRDVYREAAERLDDPVGNRIFASLADDEQNHVSYLLDRLENWNNTGKFDFPELKSALPNVDAIDNSAAKSRKELSSEHRGLSQQLLSKALRVEVDTSKFYQKLVDTLEDEGKALFARFLQIEEEHIGIVQAELDYISKSGYWMDIKEFGMEE